MKSTLLESPLITHLSDLLREILATALDETTFKPKRPLSGREWYTRGAILAAYEVVESINQLIQAVTYLRTFRQNPILSKRGITRFDHIVYHLEGHLIRAVSCRDRCLLLTNKVLRLGLAERHCLWQVVITNEHVVHSSLKTKLETINAHIKPYMDKRHVVIHRRRYEHPEMKIIEGMYILSESEPESVPKRILKEETDEFVRERIKELERFNLQLENLISELFDVALVKFQKTYEQIDPLR